MRQQQHNKIILSWLDIRLAFISYLMKKNRKLFPKNAEINFVAQSRKDEADAITITWQEKQ